MDKISSHVYKVDPVPTFIPKQSPQIHRPFGNSQQAPVLFCNYCKCEGHTKFHCPNRSNENGQTQGPARDGYMQYPPIAFPQALPQVNNAPIQNPNLQGPNPPVRGLNPHVRGVDINSNENPDF